MNPKCSSIMISHGPVIGVGRVVGGTGQEQGRQQGCLLSASAGHGEQAAAGGGALAGPQLHLAVRLQPAARRRRRARLHGAPLLSSVYGI